jgi:hypothetical protein
MAVIGRRWKEAGRNSSRRDPATVLRRKRATMVRNRQSQELYRELRQRMVHETEVYLTECLRHPEQSMRIPTVVVGHGVFTPRFAQAFWNQALGLSPTAESLLRRILGGRFGL